LVERASARFALLALLLLALPARAEIEKRVWFILDNTGSMNTNDPRGLAKLSAHMFYSLLDPNSGMDSFHLATLDGRQTVPTSGEALGEYLGQITNNVQHTYYLPAVRSAVEGLDREKLNSPDNTLRKTIVFVTDGGPDDKGPDLDAARALAASLPGRGIHLYVLLFGREAAASRPTVARMFPPGSNVEIFDDGDGSHLLWLVASVFGRAFGALVDTPRTDRSNIDLSHRLISKAAVIAFRNRPETPPLDLSLPDGTKAGGASQSWSEKGSSYALKWLKGVQHVRYGVRTDADASTLLLRVEPYHLEACDPATRKPLPPRQNPRALLATEASTFCFLAAGAPEAVTISVRSRSTGSQPAQLQESVCQSRPSTVPEGSLYQIECRFPKLGADAYPGVIEVMPSQNGVEDSASGARAEVQVYPYIKIAVDPPRNSLANASDVHRLRRDERGCTAFKFRPESGDIPGGKPEVTLQAFLDETAHSQTAYRQGSATLDGEPLEFQGGEGDWARGRSISRSEFFETNHEFCAVAGLAASGDADSTVTLPVRFFFTGYPYSELRVINDFQADARVQPPAWWELWGNGVWLGLGVLGCLVLGFGLLRWNFLPANLICRSWVEPAGAESVTPLVRSRLVPFVPDRRTVLLDNGSFTAGSIRATSPDLFEFRPAPEITVTTRVGMSFGGGYNLRVHESYQFDSPRGKYVVRIEYGGGG
jgi:hypothetical protein